MSLLIKVDTNSNHKQNVTTTARLPVKRTSIINHVTVTWSAVTARRQSLVCVTVRRARAVTLTSHNVIYDGRTEGDVSTRRYVRSADMLRYVMLRQGKQAHPH